MFCSAGQRPAGLSRPSSSGGFAPLYKAAMFP